MSVKDEEFKTKIYDLMNGSYNLEEYPVAESSVVKDEFADCCGAGAHPSARCASQGL